MSGGAWDQTRATFAQQKINTRLSVADEILFVDLELPQVATKHYIIENPSVVGRLTLRDVLDPPISGLFLVPFGEPAPGVIWTPGSRGILLPLSACYCCSVPLGTNFALGYAAQPGFKITVPRGMVLRAIAQCSEVAATSGPGALSSLSISGLAIEEPDCAVS